MHPCALFRVPPTEFTDRAKWQGWSAAGGWGKPPTPLWRDRVGEMSFKQIDGKAVLSYFNASTGNMEIRVAAHPTALGAAPVTTVVRADAWPDPAESLPSRDDNTAGAALRRLHFAGVDARARCESSSASGTPHPGTAPLTGSSSSRSTRSSRGHRAFFVLPSAVSPQ